MIIKHLNNQVRNKKVCMERVLYWCAVISLSVTKFSPCELHKKNLTTVTITIRSARKTTVKIIWTSKAICYSMPNIVYFG